MLLLYLLMLMWPPPHLLMNAVGVWRHVSLATMTSFSPPGQRPTTEVLTRIDLRIAPVAEQHHVPVVTSFLPPHSA
jgi:hypothetical protein